MKLKQRREKMVPLVHDQAFPPRQARGSFSQNLEDPKAEPSYKNSKLVNKFKYFNNFSIK